MRITTNKPILKIGILDSGLTFFPDLWNEDSHYQDNYFIKILLLKTGSSLKNFEISEEFWRK